MKTIIKKLSSRKFWMAAAGIVTGIAMVFGVDENAVATVSGAVTAVASVIAYILAEGRVDAAAVGTAAENVQNAVEAVQGGNDAANEG
jgi:phage shock protein PspC (stress-responsive transcriptional regulator)